MVTQQQGGKELGCWGVVWVVVMGWWGDGATWCWGSGVMGWVAGWQWMARGGDWNSVER